MAAASATTTASPVRIMDLASSASSELGLLPLPKGEGWGEGLRSIEGLEPPHPNPLPAGEREHTMYAALRWLTNTRA
jgi:hypothetical protein